MTRLALRTAVVCAFVVGGLAIFFGLVARSGEAVACSGCQLPRPVLVAKVAIPKGTSGRAIATRAMYSVKLVRVSERVEGAFVDPSEFRGEVTSRTIRAGARLTATAFALRGPIYYPSGYPRSVPASTIPAEMSHYLPAQSFPSDLEVAPGVWVDGSPSKADLDAHVANGTLVGYCRSVAAFQAHNRKVPFATKCWPNGG
jgi:hypothetical protein